MNDLSIISFLMAFSLHGGYQKDIALSTMLREFYVFFHLQQHLGKNTVKSGMNGKVKAGDFATGSVFGHIIRLAVPLTIAQLVHMLYSVVDRIYIGHLSAASSSALTGLGLTFPVISLIEAFTSLYGLGGAPLASISRGARKDDEAEKIMGITFSMLLLTAAGVFLLANLFMRPMLFLFGASEATYPYASSYLRIYLLGTPFVMTGTGMNNFISSQGFGRTGMITVSAGMLLNLVLDPIFIFGLGLGIQGAAIASVISQLVSAVLVIRFLTGDKTYLRIKRSTMRIEWKYLKKILSLGLAGFVMKATNGAVQMTCSSTLQIFGGDVYVGLMTVFNSVREMVSLPSSGLSDAGKPVIGYNYGAKKYDRISKAIFCITVPAIIYMLLIWLLLFLFPERFIGIFTSDPDFLTLGPEMMHIYFFGFFFMVFQTCGQTVFTGMGRARHAVFFSLFRKIVIVVPLTILLPRLGLGIKGVFIAEPISNLIGGGACYITMLISTRRLFRKEQQSLQSQP